MSINSFFNKYAFPFIAFESFCIAYVAKIITALAYFIFERYQPIMIFPELDVISSFTVITRITLFTIHLD